MNEPVAEQALTVKIAELEAELNRLREEMRELKAVEELFPRIMDATSEGILLLDAKHQIQSANRAAVQLLGYSARELKGVHIRTLYERSTIAFYGASKDHLSFEAAFQTKAGLSIPLLHNRSALRDSQGDINGHVTFLSDLTELKLTQAELRRAERRYRDIYRNAVQGMFQSTLSGQVLEANPAYARILGYESVDEILSIANIGRAIYHDPADRDGMISALKEKGVLTNFEMRLKRKDGATIWILANARLIDTGGGNGIIEGIMVDNTARKQAEEKLTRSREKFRELANRDNLTGLYNTRYLYRQLDRLIDRSNASQTPFSLVFLDIDNFKRVVDRYGHLNGSQVLKEVAETLASGLTEPCHGVAYGGDEFVLVLPGYDKQQAKAKVEEIRLQIRQATYLSNKGHAVKLRASFGLATYPDDAEDRTGLLALADRAMFHIKATGKDGIGVSHAA
ncbi:MAG: diguanylate cyclase [Desulfobacterales bacterium]